MRKKCPVFALIFLLTLLFYTPASAATEYGVIYDETDALGSQTLKMQGEQTLPQLTETLGIDLRVDVLTQIDYDRIGDAAMGIYKEYNYGYGEKKEGVTLTVLMEPQDGDTYAMSADGWCVYVSLRQGRGSSRDMAVAIRDAVEPYMVERVWNGADINMSAVALTQAVDAMAEAKKLGNARVFNTIIIGVAAKSMDFPKEQWLEVIEKTVPPKTIDINKEAFLTGYSI